MRAFPRIVLLALSLTGTAAGAEEQSPIVDETFDAPLADTWTKQFGDWKVESGVLKASQRADDEHISAFRLRQPIQDADIQVDFKAAGARMFHVGFDPAPGELAKKGHLFAVVITANRMMIQLNRDKSIETSNNEDLGSTKIDLVPGKSYSLLLKLRGDQVEANLKPADQQDWVKVAARHPTLHVKKPGIVFRVGGQDNQEIHLERIRVWKQ